MTVYHLYLDESETHNSGINRAFCLAGIIVEKGYYENTIIAELNRIKKIIWHDYSNPTNIILHEKDVRFAQHRLNQLTKVAPEYHRFRKNQYSKILYAELKNLYNLGLFTVIGSCIIEDNLYSYFDKDIISDKYLIAMQILLENYCHFLQINRGIGYIYIESRKEDTDKHVRMHFNHIKAMGSMYISPYAMQRHIQEIFFPEKRENVPGLQIADFAPNPLARRAINKQQPKYNIYQAIRKFRYDGGLMKHDRFGVKIMP